MKTLSALVIIYFLTGCAQSPIVASDSDTSVISFSERMLLGIEGISEESLKLGSLKDFDGYRVFSVGLSGSGMNRPNLYSGWASYCKKIGGEYQRRACESVDGELLFFAKADSTGRYHEGKIESGIYVIEPNNGSKKNFIQAAAWAGYTTRSQRISEKRIKEEAQLKKAMEKEVRKMKGTEEIMKGGVGSRVCKDGREYGKESGFVLIGYVENIANGNIKVSVQSAHVEDIPNLPYGGFKPYNRWFPIKQWYLC